MGTILKLPIVSNTVRPKTTWQGGFSFTKWFVTWHLQKVNTHVLKDCKNKNNQLTFALKMRFRKFTQINFKINLFWLKWSKVPTWNEHVLVYLWVKPITCYSRFKNTKKKIAISGFETIAHRYNLHPNNACSHYKYTCNVIPFTSMHIWMQWLVAWFITKTVLILLET